MKNKLSVSFSGGRTSAYMAKWLLDNKQDEYELHFIFANTGLEHEKTLDFVNECDKRWGLNLVWVEAIVDSRANKGTGHKVVTFETANRNGEPMREVIAKYGLPGPGGYMHCNREAKLQPMQSYYKSICWDDYYKAVGLRADEFDRININSEKLKIVYPLISWHYMTKPDILHWWKEQDFNLDLPEHYGNCKTCWKKSDRKLMTIAQEHPEWFDFFDEMERLYCKTGAGATDNEDGRRFFYRKKQTTAQIIARSRSEDFSPFVEEMPEQQFNMINELDESHGCSESCDIYSD